MDERGGNRPPREAAAEAGASAGAGERVLDSRELFAGAQVLVIVHGEERYRLQRTRSGKLILTK